ncbi:6-bladed beta-propeller [Candidatus Fermentibacteria bacterium]|nr:6-bladed beta-propeller [Candidatus Fermentibacteria bacterium]
MMKQGERIATSPGAGLFLVLTSLVAVLLLGCQRMQDERPRPGPDDERAATVIRDCGSLDESLVLERRVELRKGGPDALLGDVDDVVMYGAGFLVLDIWVAKRVLVFAEDGDFMTMIGRHGEGPGEYFQPRAIAMNSRGEIVVENLNPPNYNIYTSSFAFSRMIPASTFDRILAAVRLLPASGGYFLYVPVRGGKRVVKVTRDFHIAGEFFDDEPGAQQAAVGGGDIAFSPLGTVWVGGIWRPTIGIFTTEGRFVGETGQHLLDKDFVPNADLLKQAASGGIRQTLELMRDRQTIQRILRFGRLMLVGHFVYDGCQHFDVYDAWGDLLKEQMRFCAKWQRIVASSEDVLIAADTSSPEVCASDSTLAILYLYRMAQ